MAEKKALLGSHKHRFQQLEQKHKILEGADGGFQKIKSVIRAIARHDKETMDPERINDDTSPTEILKYISEAVAGYSKHEEKPEQISKIIKRLKKMVRPNEERAVHLIISPFVSALRTLTIPPKFQ